MLDAAMVAAPLLAPPSLAEDVFAAMGLDALEFVQRPEWDHFPRPHIAMVGGWGGPGSHVASETNLVLVESFKEVLQSVQLINLQMFLRDGKDGPQLPRLPDLLKWFAHLASLPHL